MNPAMLAGLTLTARGALTGARRLPHGGASEHARSMAAGMVAGLVGHFDRDAAAWSPDMSFRDRARDVTAEELLASFGWRRGETRAIDVAVLVHGLFVDEQNWTLGGDPLAARLEPHLGWTPLMVRYNTGLHISENGETLARLLEGLLDAWGPRLGRVHILGHSMGGLVARSALAALERRSATVLEHVESLFLLATPNHGADLERVGHAIEVALEQTLLLPGHGARLLGFGRRGATKRGRLDAALHDAMDRATDRTTATIGAPIRSARGLLGLRSDGIRDVRFGYMQEAEWRLDEQFRGRLLVNHRRPLPPPQHVTTYAIAGSLWPRAGTAPSRLRNDGLVSCASAAGTAGEFDDLGVVAAGRYAEVPLLMHQLLPTSSRVWRRIREWVE